MAKLDINTASKDEMLTLNYITPKIANRIINFREKYGKIDSFERLVSVSEDIPIDSAAYFGERLSFGSEFEFPTNQYFTFSVLFDKVAVEKIDKSSLIVSFRDKKEKFQINTLEYPVDKQKKVIIQLPSYVSSYEYRSINIKLIKSEKVLFDKNYNTNDIAANNYVIEITQIVSEDEVVEVEEVKINFLAHIIPEDLISNPYSNYRLIVAYITSVKADIGGKESFYENEFEVDREGKAYVTFQSVDSISEELILKVKAPGGEILCEKISTLTEIKKNDNKVILNVSAQLIHEISQYIFPKRPQKITGRIIDLLGVAKYEKIPITFFGTKLEEIDIDIEKEQQDGFYPIISVKSETNGYFIFDAPQDFYIKAYAVVGIKKEENKLHIIPVQLEEDIVINPETEQKEEKKLFFPSRLILVVNSAKTDNNQNGKSDCTDCDALGLHRDRMVLEEYSYFTAVRTTEPNIKGFTLDDDEEISLEEINQKVPIHNLRYIQNSNLITYSAASNNNITVRKKILSKYMNDRKGITSISLIKAFQESNALKLKEVVKPVRNVRGAGRQILNEENSIDWDETPTIYQATTIAHGHLLHFKQEWVSDGYSIGDLLYSLPLAPGQKKQVAVFDWERREANARSEEVDYQESLNNTLSRDRDINEVVSSVVNESTRGGSSAKTSSSTSGTGFLASMFVSSSGGSGSASSTAWQNSSRGISANSLQQLHDSTHQAASAVRSQRSTVVQTATQGESFTVETESVANYNHCHAITIQYFEVLRHLKIQHRLAGVQECLFVPLLMDQFNYQKILRWKEVLLKYLLNKKLRKGFDAIERIENDYEGSDLPENRFADENIEYLEGELYIKFQFSDPGANWALTEGSEISQAYEPIIKLLPHIRNQINRIIAAEKTERSNLFYSLIGPEIASAFVDKLIINAIIESNAGGVEKPIQLPIDPTLVSTFYNNRALYISLRMSDEIHGELIRAKIKGIEISKASDVMLDNETSLTAAIPSNSKIILEKGSIRYRTKYMSGHLFQSNRINDDLIGYGASGIDSEKVRIATPLSTQELRNPRNEDLELANALHDHLNDNLEQYHKLIWLNITPERRFMFLDGITVTDFSDSKNYPNGVLRSIASVVENKLVGIIGNNLVFPVAPGFRLDPTLKGADVDLFSLYKPLTPYVPLNISLATKGVFAEAVMGKCNSCEEKEENRFWRWSEEPIPDSPTAIQPISTDSRRAETPSMEASSMPSPMVNIQNAPQAPDPSGLAMALETLRTVNFKDITGLTQNQKNALEGLLKSYSTTESLAQMGLEGFKKIADTAAQMYTGKPAASDTVNTIKGAKEQGLISNADAGNMTKELLSSEIKNITESGQKSFTNEMDKLKQVEDSIKSGNISQELGNRMKTKIADKAVESRLIESPEVKSLIANQAGKGPINIKADIPGESLEIIAETTKTVEDDDILTFPGTTLKYKKCTKTLQSCYDTLSANLRNDFKTEIKKVIEKMYELGFAMGVLDNNIKAGYRTFEEQANLDESSTNAGPGESFHNYGIAVDLGFLEWIDKDGKVYTDDFWLGNMDAISDYISFSAKLWDKRDSFKGSNLHTLSFERIHMQSLKSTASGVNALVKTLNAATENGWMYRRDGSNNIYQCDFGNRGDWKTIGTAKQMWNKLATNCTNEQKEKIKNEMKAAETKALTIDISDI